jgi:hypothetical protein
MALMGGNAGAFPALLQDGREVWSDTSAFAMWALGNRDQNMTFSQGHDWR